MSIADLVKPEKVELVNLEQESFTIIFRAKNQRIFQSVWKNYGFRHITCTGVRKENTDSSSILRCLNHDIRDKKCSYYFNFFPQERLINMNLTSKPNQNHPQNILHGNQSFIDDSHLPQYSAKIEYEGSESTDLPLLNDLRRSIIPILINKDKGKIIYGTSFYIQFEGNTYIVSAKHVLVKSDALIDYNLGFEGVVLNELYFLTRSRLKQDNFTWTWLDIEGDVDLDIIVAKVEFTTDFIQKLALKPIMVDLIDFKIGPGDEVRSFGYPHGHGEDIGNLFYHSKDNYELDENIVTLIPLALKGHLLDINKEKGVVNLTSNLAAGKGLSGSPLIHLQSGSAKLLGINYAGPIEVVDKEGLRAGKSVKSTTKYGSKMKTIHVGHLVNLLQSPEMKARKAVTIGLDHLQIEHRDLSLISSKSKTIS